MLPLLTEEEIEVLRFDLSYNCPVAGGIVVDYMKTLDLDSQEALRLRTKLRSEQNSSYRILAKLHGFKVD